MMAEKAFMTLPASTNPLTDFSIWALVLSNIITLVFAIMDGWSLLTVIAIYWAQSVIIGIFNFIRILTVKNYDMNTLKLKGFLAFIDPVKIFMAFFFLVHYGIFHLVYAVFIFSAMQISPTLLDFGAILPVTGIFFLNHLFSFAYNFTKDRNKKKDLGKLMFFPYARILPMHLTIIFGGIFMGLAGGWLAAIGLAFFMILKTIADVIMHYIEHRIIK